MSNPGCGYIYALRSPGQLDTLTFLPIRGEDSLFRREWVITWLKLFISFTTRME